MYTSKPKGRYLQGLDGLRALAVLAVLLYHVAPGILPGGFIGVDIFFVMSGLLITTLLIEEYNSQGFIHLRQFWLRRARRLLPALLVTICISSSVAYFIGGDILVGIARQIAGALTFSNNWVEISSHANYFDSSSTHIFTNFWSLAVEEQFYLFWPFIVTILLSWRVVAKRPQVGVLFCASLALISALLMATLYRNTDATRVYYGTDAHIFGLMLGSMMAFLARLRTLRAQKPIKPGKYILRHFGWAALAGLLGLMFLLRNESSLTFRGGLQAASVLSAMCIVSVITTRGSLHKVFTWKPLAWIGLRSYAIYLWHWPALALLRVAFPTWPTWIVGAITVAFSFGAAAISFVYLETPIRKEGIKAFVLRGIRKERQVVGTAFMEWKLRPHPIAITAVFIVSFTIFAVINAPSKTAAQLNIEEGQATVTIAKQLRTNNTPVISDFPPTQTIDFSARRNERQKAALAHIAAPEPGQNITLVGDSVALASASAIEQRFPGIYIDAAVSRSLPRGGFDVVDSLLENGSMRSTVIIALGTNGFYGQANLDTLLQKLGNRKVVFVASHADVPWIEENNREIHIIANAHHNVRIAEWDAKIASHGDLLADGIHPYTAGAVLYASSIASALAAFPQN